VDVVLDLFVYCKFMEKFIAIVYLLIFVITFLMSPFHFGEEKHFTKFTPQEWLFDLIFFLPVIYLLIKFL